MTNIANAIRAKLNVDTEYTPPQMSQAINSIQVAVPIQLEEKTVSPSESATIVTPSTGKDGLSKVTVNAVSKTYVGSSVARQAAKTITPSDSNQTAVAAERYTTGAITVSAVPTETKTITTNGTYTASSGKWFKSVTVNIPVGDTINNQANKTVTPSTSSQEITPDSGYTGLAKVTVNAIPSQYIIPTGNKEITNNGTGIDVTNFATVSVNVPVGATINNQSKTATPNESEQVITFDSGYTGLSQVTVGAISKTYVGSSVTRQGAKTITPSKSEQTAVAASTYTTGIVKVAAIPSSYIIPSGNKEIKANGTNIDVKAYSTVSVAVPSSGATINNQDKTVTPSESSQSVTADSGYTGLGTVTVNAISSTYVGTDIARLDSDDLTTSGATVNVPAGYYESAASKSVSTMTLPTAATSSATSGFTSKATINRSTSDQYINIPAGYNSTGGYYKISAVANGSVTAPSTISGSTATITTGTNTITLTKTVSVTPNVITAGYISAGTAGNASVSLTASVTTKAAATYRASTSAQTIAAGTYLTGAQTIAAVSQTNLSAANIKAGTTISVSNGSSNIWSVTGSFTSDANAVAADLNSGKTAYVNGSKITGTQVINKYYTGSSAPASSLGSNGDIYLQE